MNETEKKVVVYEVADWLWGTIKGGFNEQQSISQIIVDAVIGMIPLVGDVTAVRDLIAVTLRLIDDPKKREDKFEWLTLALLLFALVPVLGGVIKGVGKLLLKATAEAASHVRVLGDVVALLNRLGRGDAVKFVKQLAFGRYTAEILGHWRAVTQRFEDVCTLVIERVGGWLSPGMRARMTAIQEQVRVLRALGERMIPDGIKELDRRLKTMQQHLYEGEWHAIPDSLVSKTREVEARVVTEMTPSGPVTKWKVENAHFPPSDPDDFAHVDGWPNLKDKQFMDQQQQRFEAIESFSGPIRAVRLPAGTRLYRIVTATSRTDGRFWSYTLPKDGLTWRTESAVLESWSTNGFYVELTVPDSGLVVWDGIIASQVDSSLINATAGQYLKGGATQVFVDFAHPANSMARKAISGLKPTNWTGHLNVNVPVRTTTVQRLGPREIEPKISDLTARASARALQSQTERPGEPAAEGSVQ